MKDLTFAILWTGQNSCVHYLYMKMVLNIVPPPKQELSHTDHSGWVDLPLPHLGLNKKQLVSEQIYYYTIIKSQQQMYQLKFESSDAL